MRVRGSGGSDGGAPAPRWGAAVDPDTPDQPETVPGGADARASTR